MKYAKVYAEDIQVGSEMPPLAKPPIQQIQLTRYAGASGDFNPIHQDAAFAIQSRALPTSSGRGARDTVARYKSSTMAGKVVFALNSVSTRPPADAILRLSESPFNRCSA